ncbi:MAG: CPBP family intramembrane metalloprotease [Coriobacteriia bacterium]|nr:CPBP family intramembrane metalloprotease [Coriobacteriia bacterium]
MESTATKKQIILWVIGTWVLLWLMAIPVLAVLTFVGEGFIFLLVYASASWSPTIALMLLFKKLYPDITRREFFRTVFSQRLNIPLILTVTIVQVLIFIASVTLVSQIRGVSLMSMLNLSVANLGMCLFTAITQGATGEESGWRGFLQPTLERRFTVLTSALMVGPIWWFWHVPMMVFDSGHQGWAWIQYAVIFLVFCASLSVIIAVCYKRCRNLFIPMWIHFVFNVTIPTFIDFNEGAGELTLLTIITALYFLAALGYVIWYKRVEATDPQALQEPA